MNIPDRKIIIAHRGAPTYAHENTLESFHKAVEFGAQMIEFDVRRTADGHLIVHHDPEIIRDQRSFKISELSFKDLQSVAQKSSFTIPTVVEVLKNFNGKTGFDIELKVRDCEEEMLSLKSKYVTSDCIFTSFIADSIKELKRLSPECKAGFLLNSASLLSKCELSAADLYCPDKKLYTSHRKFFLNAYCNGLQIAVWTVDRKDQIKRFLNDPAIHAIITNRCDRALQLLNNY